VVQGAAGVDDHELLARVARRRSPANARGCRFAANATAPIIPRESAEKDEDEPSRRRRKTTAFTRELGTLATRRRELQVGTPAHADRYGQGCPSAPAMQHSSGPVTAALQLAMSS
jgi:hypothetical protein